MKRDLSGGSFRVGFGRLRTRGWPRGQRGFEFWHGGKVALHFHPLGISVAAVRQISVRAEVGGDNGFKSGFVGDPSELSLLEVGLRVIFAICARASDIMHSNVPSLLSMGIPW